jgi:thiamine monophosphate kinase
MTFEPRIRTARQLAQTTRITSMIDLSDGLSRDLPHICQLSKVGAHIRAELVPIHADARALSCQDGIDPLMHALNDGEDHELLFTTPDEPMYGKRIGTIIAGTKLSLRYDDRDEPLLPRGWEHSL